MSEHFDIVFLGGGPAGYQGAIRAAQLGAKTAVVEESFVGGVCLNWGCIPTKTVRASAEAGRTIRRAREYGFKPVEAVSDMAAVIARKERVVGALRSSIERLFEARKVILFQGRGFLVSPQRIEVQSESGTRLIEAARIVVATGSRPAKLPVFPEDPRVFTPDEMLSSPLSPQHLLVVGGGAVGVEMAAIYRELGSQVVLVEAQDRILPQEDSEAVANLLSILNRRKVKVHCGVTVQSVDTTDDSLVVRLSNGLELTPDTILVAVGRKLNSEGLGLETLGVDMDHGRILVDSRLRTNVPGLYAAGDVIGGWLLAHTAFAEGIRAAENALGMGEAPMDYRVIPRCVFSLPEYAAVGLSEEDAQVGHAVKVARFPFKSLGMAQALGELEGIVKIVADSRTDRILGAHIVGPHAADCITEIALAMQAGLPARALMDTIHTHPTLSEAVLEVAQALHGRAIHLPPEAMDS